jgi:hypothetical protein
MELKNNKVYSFIVVAVGLAFIALSFLGKLPRYFLLALGIAVIVGIVLLNVLNIEEEEESFEGFYTDHNSPANNASMMENNMMENNIMGNNMMENNMMENNMMENNMMENNMANNVDVPNNVDELNNNNNNNNVERSEQVGNNEDYKSVEGELQSRNHLPNDCYPKDVLSPEELLPKDVDSVWAQSVPAGQGSLGDKNFLNAGFHVGVNTVGQSMRNANRQIRSEPPNPQVKVSPWLQSTIEPDLNRKPLEIGA